jgi:Tol biopolymer transport system component
MTALKPQGFSLGTVSPDGSGRAVVLRGSKRGIYPNPFSRVSWSPDGTWLYFAGGDGRRSGIYKLRADGTGLRFLRGTKEGTNPVLSPDGSKLAFTRDTFSGFIPTGTAIWVGDGEGHGASQRRRWGVETKAMPSSFAPDNSQLAVTLSAVASEKTSVLLLQLDQGGRARLLARRASEAVFSPDGSKIALVRHTLSSRGPRFTVDRDLYVMDADGSSSTPVMSTPKIGETQPSWDPLGQRIAFNAYHNSKSALDALFDELLPVNNSIVEVNADGTCRQKVLKLPGAILRGAAWQPGTDRATGRIEC